MEIIIKKKNKSIEYKKINKEKINVVAYARVSTEMEEQQLSFESQRIYYYNKISSNDKWNFCGIYADEGISGTGIKKREGFKQMIREGMMKKYDLILTKSVSRFARNTVDTLKYVRMLKNEGVGIYFEEENINTLDSNGELLITILGSLAQQEIENISSHSKKGRQMAIKTGTIKMREKCWGYDSDKENNRYVINKEQAKIIKKIFDIFEKEKQYSIVSQYLYDKNIPSPRGLKVWSYSTIRTILQNEKYIGDVRFNKSYVISPLEHRTITNKGEYDSYIYKNNHEAIISKEQFDRVQEIIKQIKIRYNDFCGHKGDKNNILLKKGVCGYCYTTIACKRDKVYGTKYYKCRYSDSRLYRSVCAKGDYLREEEIKNSYLKIMRLLKKRILTNQLNTEDMKRLGYISKYILTNDFKKFDYDVFNKLIQYVIIGGYDKNGKENRFKIEFVLFEDDLFEETNRFIHKKDIKRNILVEHELKLDDVIYKNWYDEKFHQTNVDKIDVCIEVFDNEQLIWRNEEQA